MMKSSLFPLLLSLVLYMLVGARFMPKYRILTFFSHISHFSSRTYCIRYFKAICKVITTLDRKRAFDICMETHGIGKATLTKTWKKKAESYCLNLQREGLTVSIVPDKAFGGGGGGGEGGGGSGSGGGGPDMS
jgi:uncharacterized membrane protein YgcG